MNKLTLNNIFLRTNAFCFSIYENTQYNKTRQYFAANDTRRITSRQTTRCLVQEWCHTVQYGISSTYGITFACSVRVQTAKKQMEMVQNVPLPFFKVTILIRKHNLQQTCTLNFCLKTLITLY